MRLEYFHYEPKPETVFVDLSWLMYRSRYAMMNLSFVTPEGEVPTGHLHGSMMSIMNLSASYQRVVLAVDSRSPRKEIYSGYKEGRKKPNATELERYDIKLHTKFLLALASSLPNVYFIKENGLEADDLINHVISRGDDPDVFANDNDLYMNRRPCRFLTALTSGDTGFAREYLDLQHYITEKYKLIGFSYLPIWYKVIRGDSSDNLPPAAPRYSGKLIQKLAGEMDGRMDWESFEQYIKETMDEKLDANREALWRNYRIVSPIIPAMPLMLKKLTMYPVLQEASSLGLLSVINNLQYYPGTRLM